MDCVVLVVWRLPGLLATSLNLAHLDKFLCQSQFPPVAAECDGSWCHLAQLLLDDFSGPNIEATAALLDTAGRFLYRTPETHERMASMAEVLPGAMC